jgi:zinc protease
MFFFDFYRNPSIGTICAFEVCLYCIKILNHMKIIKSAAALLFFLSIGVQSIFAQDLQVPLHRDVVKGELSNGLKYYILENGKPQNKVELRLVVNAGSILETDAQQGLAHFVEHMAFNGTKNFKKNELVDYLQSVGVKFGAHLNAYTSFDETVYMLSLPSDDEEILKKGFQILGDWAGAVSFDSDEIDKERGVVLEEYRLRLGAENRMMELYLPKLLFQSHYADRLPIGKKTVLENFKHKEVRDFYTDWYRPDLMSVIVVGDVDKAAAEAMVKQFFSGLSNPANEKPRKLYDVPNHNDLKVSVVQDGEATRNEVQIIIKKGEELEQSGSVQAYDEGLERRLFTSMFNARLRELATKPDAPFSYSWGRLGSIFTRSKAGFSMSAIVGNGQSLQAYKQMLQEIERVKRNGFQASELERALKNMHVGIEAQLKEESTTSSRAFLGGLQNHFLKGSPFVDAVWRMEHFMEFESTVNLERINAIAQDWLGLQNAVVIMKGPATEEYPDRSQLIELWQQRDQMPVEHYQENELPMNLLEAVPKTGSLVSKEKNEKVGLTTLKLSNGATVIFKQTEFKSDQVLFTAFSKGGMSLVEDSEFHKVRFGMGVIGSSGVGNFSENDLEKMLSGKKVGVTPFVGNISEGLRGSASPENLEELFQLTHLFFKQPRLDEQAWETYRNRQISLTKNLMASPSSYYRLKWRAFTAEDHPRNWKLPQAKDWATMDYNLIYKVGKERFASASDFTFVFVGNIEEHRLIEFVEMYLCPLPSGATENFKDHGMRPKKGEDKLLVKKGTEPKSVVNLYFTGETQYDEQEAYYLKCLGEVLKIKLTETLREEMSGVYGTSAYGGMNQYPNGTFYFGIGFPCGPENVEDLKTRALEELAKIIKNGPSKKDLDKIKEAQLRDNKVNMKSNRYWMNHIKSETFSGGDINSILLKENRIKELSPKNLQDVGKKYLSGDHLEGILMPE